VVRIRGRDVRIHHFVHEEFIHFQNEEQQIVHEAVEQQQAVQQPWSGGPIDMNLLKR
jgi:hypothetical protein